MRQFWAGVLLLGLMVGLLFWNMAWVQGLAAPMAEDLSQGAAAVQAGDWDQAADRTRQALERWQANQSRLRVVRLHGEIDELSILLQEMAGTLQTRETAAYLSAGRRAMEQVASLQRAEQISLENLF